MSAPRAGGRKLFRVPWRTSRQIHADVDEELRFHFDMRIESLVAEGLSPDEARARALREFGDLDDARRYMGYIDRTIEAAQRRSEYMREFISDLAYAFRKLRAAPVFAATVVLTLALGIGANTAIFSVVDSVLLRSLPFPNADRLVRLQFYEHGDRDAGSPAELKDFRTLSHTLDGVAMYGGIAANLVRPNGEAELLVGVNVSANWFDILRVRPLLGRAFKAGEDSASAPKVVMLSEGVWRNEFSSDPAIVGKGIRLNGDTYTVVGVVPAGHGYPTTADVWLPFVTDPGDTGDRARGARWVSMMGRLRDGVTLDEARADLHNIARRDETRFPKQYRQFDVRPMLLQQASVEDIQKPLLVIMAAVGLVLLVACANVANLMLVRASARDGEFAIRTALGAGRGRLARQLVTESLVLTLLGALVGLALARWGTRALLHIAPLSLTQLQRTTIDGTTLAATAAIAGLTAIIFGVLPAIQGSRSSVADTLRGAHRGTRGGPASNRIKRAIIVAEVAMAVVLLAGAGLLIRSFQNLMAVNPGFRTESTLAMRVTLPDAAYKTHDAQLQFVSALGEKLRAIPGVRSLGIASALPLDGSDFTISFTVRGRAPVPENQQPSAEIICATPTFIPTLGIPLIAGRNFTAADGKDAPQVVLVSEAFVKRNFSNEDPLGKYIELGWSENGHRRGGTVVGIVGDVKQYGLDADAPATLYLPYAQSPQATLRVVLRTAVPPASIGASVRGAVQSLDRELPVFSMHTLDDQVATSVAPQRFYKDLVTLFALVALALAAVGLYGVIAYSVSQRTHELGLRVALGATGDRITRMVVGEGLWLTIGGAVFGVIGALLAGRVLASLLFGVGASDPVTIAAVVLVLLAVATLASWLPARRAARVDPLVAMRSE